MNADQSILVERTETTATITFNRPHVRNAIDDATRAAFTTAFAELAGDPEVRVIVLTGAGSSFCAGGDVKAMRGRLGASRGGIAINGWRRQRHTAAMIQAIHDAPVITVAAVNGPAMGLGMDLALACDFIVAAPEARFASSFVRRGLIPDGGSLYFLPRRVGLQKAKELIFSGRSVSSEEALDIGLVDRLASTGELAAEVIDFIAQFTRNSGPAISLMKSIVDRAFESSLSDVAQLGGQAQSISYTTDEHQSSVESFFAEPAGESDVNSR